MKITAALVRDQYPHPRPAPPQAVIAADEAYCVTGAFMRACGFYDESFPQAQNVAPWLIDQNPALNLDSARTHASLIAVANDRGDFELAWKRLAAALGETPEPDPQPEEEADLVEA